MSEFIRIFNKKTLMLFFVMLVLNAGIFIFGANPNKDITVTGRVLEEYIEEYPRFLQETINRGKSNQELKIFKEGFSNELNRKTVQRYETLIGIKPTAGDNRGIALFFENHISELLALFFILHIVTLFFEERKTGLDYMVRATGKGRGNLYFKRLGILCFASFSSNLFLMGGNLIGVSVTFGTDNLLRPIQSIPVFQRCPYRLTILSCIIVIFIIRVVGIFLSGLLMYMIMGMTEKILFYIITGGTICFEITCGMFIAPASSMYILKVVNIYTLINSNDFFTDCIYLDIFGNAVEGTVFTGMVCSVFIIILVFFGFFIFEKRYITSTNGFIKIIKRIEIFKEKISFAHSCFIWECYKLFIKQGAVIVIAICLIIHVQQSAKYEYYYSLNAEEKLMYLRYKGEITEEKKTQAENWMSALKSSEMSYEKKLNEIMNAIPFDSKKYTGIDEALKKNRNLQKSFEPVLSDIRSAYEFALKTGKRVSLIEPYSYDFLFNRDNQTRNRSAFLTIAVIIGALAGIYVIDRNTNMNLLINSTYAGRNIARRIKPVLVICISVFCTFAFSLIQMININNTLPFPDIDKPVQGLRYLNDFPIYMSIRAYLVLILIIRGLFGILIGSITALFSYFGKDKFEVICKVTILMVIWMLVTELIPYLEIISPIKLLGYV